MRRLPPLFYWLAVAATADWFITRLMTRLAIHIPKNEIMIVMYQGVNWGGQVATSLVALLSLGILFWLAWKEWQHSIWLPLALTGRAVVSLLFLVIVPSSWLVMLHHGLTLLIIGLLGWRLFQGSTWGGKIGWGVAWLLPALSLLVGVMYQIIPTLYTVLHLAGPSLVMGWLFNLGELLVVLSVAGLWWVYGRFVSWRIWLFAAIPMVFFAISFWRDAAMTGILTIWSTGLTLYLPWPVYALALWLVGVTILATWRQTPAVAYAILLLISAGYAPQLSSQLFCAIIGIWLLMPAPVHQPVTDYVAQPVRLAPRPHEILVNQ